MSASESRTSDCPPGAWNRRKSDPGLLTEGLESAKVGPRIALQVLELAKVGPRIAPPIVICALACSNDCCVRWRHASQTKDIWLATCMRE
eukprot:4515476-Alexandrium_andersonii.AAC.1